MGARKIGCVGIEAYPEKGFIFYYIACLVEYGPFPLLITKGHRASLVDFLVLGQPETEVRRAL